MDIKVAVGTSVEALIILQAEGADLPSLDDSLRQIVTEMIDTGDFDGKSGQVSVLYPRETAQARRLILVGSGDNAIDTIRRAAATGLRKARELKAKTAAVIVNEHSPRTAEAIAEGALLGLYDYHGQKTGEKPDALPETLTLLVTDETVIGEIEAAVKAGVAVATGTNLARDLVNLPANICTPAYLAQAARGGVGTSAAFLQHFVDYPAWAHLDIAGVAGIEGLSGNSDNSYVPSKGATGFGVRLMTDFVRHWQEKS